MAEFIDTWLPLIMTSIIGIVVAAVAYFAKQNATTVGGTIRLESVQTDVNDIKNEVNKGLEEIKKLIERKEAEQRIEFREVTKRIESLEREGYNLRYRIDQTEKRLDARNGGTRSPV